MKIMDAVFGVAGLALLAGTGYAVASTDLPSAGGGEHRYAQSQERRLDRAGDDDRSRVGPAAAPQMTLAQAVERAGALGFTSVREAEYEHGRFEIEGFDAQGRKVEIHLDAATGALLKQGYDD